MRSLKTWTPAAIALAATLIAAPAGAATVTVPAGGELTLTADVTLSAADDFMAGSAGGARCRINGNGFGIKAPADGNWSGRLSIQSCDVTGLGAKRAAAIDVTGGQSIAIEDTAFDLGGQIALNLGAATAVTFRRNTIEDKQHRCQLPPEDVVDPPGFLRDICPAGILAVIKQSQAMTEDVFFAKGRSTGPKLFQGNKILLGLLHFNNTSGWELGGVGAGEGNLLVGVRTGIFLEATDHMNVRGNYLHNITPPGWNEVKNLSLIDGAENIIEHNILQGRNWLVEFKSGGQLAYNLLLDPIERAWVQVWSEVGAKVHHNVMAATKEDEFTPEAGVVVLNADPAMPATTEVYNNTFDAGGVCNRGVFGGVHTGAASHLLSLRSNAFTGMRLPRAAPGWLIGGGAIGVKTVPDPLPSELGYSDYNLFYNPDDSVKANYGVGVEGKVLGMDAGFGLHDIPADGAVNPQVDPKFAAGARIPRLLPFDEMKILKRTTTVCQILAYYRSVYAPGAGSPLIDAGDPLEGGGNDIGAIGAGIENALDQFGKLCDPADVGEPSQDSTFFTCPPIKLEGGGGTGVLPPPPAGFTCVCDAGAAGGGGAGVAGLGTAGALAMVLVARARRRRLGAVQERGAGAGGSRRPRRRRTSAAAAAARPR